MVPTPSRTGRWLLPLALVAGLVPASRAQAPVESAVRAALPALDHEPELRVFLARGPAVTVQVDARVRLEVAGGHASVGPGRLRFEAAPGGWRIAGAARVESGAGRLRGDGEPVFALDATPEFGKGRRLRLGGDLEVRAVDGQVEVVERIGMEDYLAGVVGAEMNARWPASALAAQAIVARSYAAARWMERQAETWDVHWQLRRRHGLPRLDRGPRAPRRPDRTHPRRGADVSRLPGAGPVPRQLRRADRGVRPNQAGRSGPGRQDLDLGGHAGGRRPRGPRRRVRTEPAGQPRQLEGRRAAAGR